MTSLVYHPSQWAFDWPKGQKPYASESLAVAHGHKLEDIVSSPFSGSIEDVETELPKPAAPAEELTQEEKTFVAENPGAVVDAVVPPEPTEASAAVAPQASSQAPAVTPAPARATASASTKPTKKKN